MEDYAQTPPPFNYTPIGEDVVIFVGEYTAPLTINPTEFVVTSKALHSTSSTLSSNASFEAPEGTDIVDARFKLSNLGLTLGDILVLLSDGRVLKLEYDGSNSFDVEELDPVPTQDAFQLLGDDLYVMSYDRVFVSDSGYNWTVDTVGLSGSPYLLDIDIDMTQKVWLCASHGLFTQELNSLTWIKNDNYPGEAFVQDACDLVFISREQDIWVSNFNSLRVSFDSGETFQLSPSGLGSAFIRDIADDVFGNIYVMSDNDLYFSQGGTEPFVQIDQPLIADFDLFPTNIVYNDAWADTTLYLATAAGIYVSEDQGENWNYNGAVRAEQVYSVSGTTDDRLLMTTNTGLFRLETNDSWTKSYPQNGFVPATEIFTANNGDLYLKAEVEGANSGGSPVNMIYKSSDDANNFEPDTNGIGSADVGMNLFFTDENGIQHASGRVAPGSILKIWKKNPGNAWETDLTGLPDNMNFDYHAFCFGSDNNGKVYIALQNNGISTIYSRPIAGGDWSSETTINGMVMNIKGRNGIVTIASTVGVRYNNGSAWQSAPLPEGVSTSINWCLSEVDNNSVLWAYFETYNPDVNASEGEGIYYSDNFTSWTEAGDLSPVLFSELQALGDSLFALTAANNGVYVLDTISGNTLDLKITDAGAIAISVYPNPNKGLVNMKFILDNNSVVGLKIYNVAGETILEIPLMKMNPGEQVLEIRLPEQASGTLLYKLTVDGKTNQGKMLMIKN